MPNTGISIRDGSVAQVVTGVPATDQVSIDLTVDGTPAGGTTTILYASTPVVGTAVAVLTQVSRGVGAGGAGTIWRVSVPRPGLWYFWAQDTNGITPVAAAGWPGLSPIADLNLAGQFLADTLDANRAGLEAALRAVYFAGVSIKQIVYGTSASVTDFPAILVTKPRESAEWVALPLIREHTYRFDIYLFLLHQDRSSLIPVAAQFTAAGMSVLNKIEYESGSLASGTQFAFAMASEGDVDEVQIDEAQWCAIGSVVWSCRALKQGGGVA